MSLQDWLTKRIFPFEDKLNGEAVYAGMLLGIAESLRFGIVSTTDMYYFCDDMARAVLYMDVRYKGGTNANGQAEPDLQVTDNLALITVTPSGQVQTNGYMGKKSDLIAWSLGDPPDDYERLRNEAVFSFQHNRNPFIDHPEWVECVFNNTNCPPPSCPNSDIIFQHGFE